MHKGLRFPIEQRLRAFAPSILYPFGWPPQVFEMTTGMYTGSAAVFVTTPTPDLTLESFDTDGLGGDFTGRLCPPALADLKVGFHFRMNADMTQPEAWIQCYFNGQRSMFEPGGTNSVHYDYAWNGVNSNVTSPGGPFANQIRPTSVRWNPKLW